MKRVAHIEPRPGGAMPRHIGIIMDGNGRWANSRGLPRAEGHRRGVERAREVIQTARDLGIEALTLYGFSSENWQRPYSEVSFLMKLLDIFLRREMHEFKRQNTVFRTIGDLSRLPDDVREVVREAEKLTAECDGMVLTVALSYGGRDEILRAAKKIAAAGLGPDEINEETFSRLLDTAGLPEPDFIIRTSGEKRISNFLLWQSAYSELYFTETLWPDFGREQLLLALSDYQSRDRRFGAVKTTL